MTLPLKAGLRVFIPFALGYFLSYLFRTINAVIAPDLVHDFGLDATGLGLLTSVYFLTFAVFQLPLGILLDRYGPRKTESALLMIAALGAFIFAMAESSVALLIGRALIGLGVSACLMAAFKSFVMWFPRGQLPFINGVQMVAGGLGALSATTPVEAALRFTDWRGVFMIAGWASIVVALIVFLAVPKRKDDHDDTGLREQIGGIAYVFSNPFFWRIAPLTVAAQAAFISIQGLWTGPWLRDVAGFDRDGVANGLLIISISMITGFFILGLLAERLGRFGVKPINLSLFGFGVFMTTQAAIIMNGGDGALFMWGLFGFFGATGILPYAALCQSFPKHITGRVITGLNLMVFLGAFLAQWGIGAIINRWPETLTGGYQPQSYQAAFGIMLALQVLALAWFAIYRKGSKESD